MFPRFLKKRKLLLFIIFLSLIGLLLKVLFVWKFSMAFTYDQGRDLLDLREMLVLNKLRLIGANTSLHGVFYGPFWYWFSFPFYLLTNGHPMSTLIPLLIFSFLMPIFFFLLVEDKKLGLVLSSLYIFSSSFFFHSTVALNTNPMIFLTPLLLVSLAKFFNLGKVRFFSLALFLIALFFHYEPIIGLIGLPILFISTLVLQKWVLVWKNKKAFLFFVIPFLPQVIFEFRHNFLQTRALLTLLTGGGSSLTPDSGGLVFRFFDRLRIFKESFIFQSGNPLVALTIFVLILLLFFKILRINKHKEELDYLVLVGFISLILVFFGFVIYPYALWPWYLGTVDALVVTLIGIAIYFILLLKFHHQFLSFLVVAVLIVINVVRYLPWPPDQVFSSDAANLRTRLAVVDLIYGDSSSKGMNILTFAPYVYDYPYQYLIWWRAKTRYNYLPEQYFYLPNQPVYVAAKAEADSLISSRKSTCDYLIIEPFESQEKWFWDWRGRFPEAKKSWEIGKTRIEKLCQ